MNHPINDTEKIVASSIDLTGTALSPRLQAMRERVLKAPQEISLYRVRGITEAIDNNPGLPRNIQFAEGLKKTWDMLPISIAEDEQIVGALTEKTKGSILHPEIKSDFLVNSLDELKTRDSLDRYLISDEEMRQLKEEILPFWNGKSAWDEMLTLQSNEMRALMDDVTVIINNSFQGGNHLAHINYSLVLENGIEGIIRQARQYAQALDRDAPDAEEKKIFYSAVILSLEALVDFAARYSALAGALAKNDPSQERRAMLKKIAKITKRVPVKAAQTFREAIQSFWFTFLGLMNLDAGMEIPLGRMDQYLYRFYKQDLDKGIISRTDALELLEELFIKLNQLPYLKETAATLSHDGGFPRTITIGGVNAAGEDAANELSLLILDAAEALHLTHPNIAVRLHPGSSEPFRKRIFRIMTGGANIIHVFNDIVMIDGFVKMRRPIEAARDYIISGCVQPMPTSTYGPSCANYLVGPRILNRFLANDISRFTSYEELWQAFKAHVRSFWDIAAEGQRVADLIQHRLLPNPILSALIDGVLENGKDVKGGGARYNQTGTSLIGLGTMVDSLAAIRELVFEKKTHSLQEILQWLAADFSGFEPQHQSLLNRIPKYGNNDSRADDIALEIVDLFHEIVSTRKPYKGGTYVLGLHSENLHVLLGLLSPATPDGRKMGDPFSPGCGPTSGMDQNGPTASLNSMAVIDYTKVMGGASSNLRFNQSFFRTERDKDLFGTMVEAFFSIGGQHLQVNSVDTETLLKAQQNPENYQDLIVRITGFSARFIELSAFTQNEIIKRSEMQGCEK